jgi:hypothetical protein
MTNTFDLERVAAGSWPSEKGELQESHEMLSILSISLP